MKNPPNKNGEMPGITGKCFGCTGRFRRKSRKVVQGFGHGNALCLNQSGSITKCTPNKTIGAQAAVILRPARYFVQGKSINRMRSLQRQIALYQNTRPFAYSKGAHTQRINTYACGQLPLSSCALRWVFRNAHACGPPRGCRCGL